MSPASNIVLVALLDGIRVGQVAQTRPGRLRFTYDDAWRRRANAYPLSLSLPLSAAEHDHKPTEAFLWGLLPDNAQTLDRYGRAFGVSPRNPAALLVHMGADCAGAVQFAPPDRVSELTATHGDRGVRWLESREIAEELRSVRETGIPNTSAFRNPGQFSLAGAQPKLALLQEGRRWGRPRGRTPTTCILKPPSGAFPGFVENEHFCLELAGFLELGAVTSTVRWFSKEVALVVKRFDRLKRGHVYTRIHQEDCCQARAIPPSRKYQNEGGPSIADIVTLLRESSVDADDDIARLLGATTLNWVIAATDAHAKNYALLHGPRGVRLAPFYDILSFLPYADDALHRVKLAMSIGGEYSVRRVNRTRWETLAKENALPVADVLDTVRDVLAQLPRAVDSAAESSTGAGIDATVVRHLATRVRRRTRECTAMLAPQARG